MKLIVALIFATLTLEMGFAQKKSFVSLKGFDRYMPNIEVEVHKNAQNMLPLILEAFENLEPQRKPINGGYLANYKKKIIIKQGNKLKLIKTYEDFYNTSEAAEFGVSGVTEYELTVASNVSVSQIETFIKRNFINRKFVKSKTHKLLLLEWECRNQQSNSLVTDEDCLRFDQEAHDKLVQN